MSAFGVLLFLHVMGAIVAFGPTYAFGISAGMAEAEPRNIGFSNRARSLVSSRLTVPGTVSMAVTGAGMILVTGYPWLDPSMRWLQLAIVLYVAAVAYTVLVTWRTQRRLAELGAQLAARRAAMAAEPASPATATADAAIPPTPGNAGPAPAPQRPSGPPPELAALIHKVRRDGKAMGVIVVAIVFLMVVKPPFPF